MRVVLDIISGGFVWYFEGRKEYKGAFGEIQMQQILRRKFDELKRQSYLNPTLDPELCRPVGKAVDVIPPKCRVRECVDWVTLTAVGLGAGCRNYFPKV